MIGGNLLNSFANPWKSFQTSSLLPMSDFQEVTLTPLPALRNTSACLNESPKSVDDPEPAPTTVRSSTSFNNNNNSNSAAAIVGGNSSIWDASFNFYYYHLLSYPLPLPNPLLIVIIVITTSTTNMLLFAAPTRLIHQMNQQLTHSVRTTTTAMTNLPSSFTNFTYFLGDNNNNNSNNNHINNPPIDNASSHFEDISPISSHIITITTSTTVIITAVFLFKLFLLILFGEFSLRNWIVIFVLFVVKRFFFHFEM